MILSDTEITQAVLDNSIVIDPFIPANLGGNSYDVHLGPVIKVYAELNDGHQILPLDARADNPAVEVLIPGDGLVLHPGTLYLASTVEYTETHSHVPYLDGKSSVGRLGIAIHATAGRGDVGFCGHWTMEIFVVQPVKVYAGMPIGQITFHQVHGRVHNVYGKKGVGGQYNNRESKPQPSRLWKSFGR